MEQLLASLGQYCAQENSYDELKGYNHKESAMMRCGGCVLEIVNHVFTLRAIESIHLPEYKGSAFHGGFGHALRGISPLWSDYFLKPKNDEGQALPPPYVLLPPLDEKSTYEAGEGFSLSLTLFGKANQHYALAQSAVEYLGRQLGLGYRQGKYAIEEIQTQPVPFESNARQTKTQRIQLELTTRLRLKLNNRLHQQAPNFHQFMSRLIGRIKTLQYAYDGLNYDDENQLIPEFTPEQFKSVQFEDRTNWDDWDRFSGRQKTWMKFGGLLGAIRYQGELQPFMPLLRLGEWIHIGGKTSFGLGKYRLIEDAME